MRSRERLESNSPERLVPCVGNVCFSAGTFDGMRAAGVRLEQRSDWPAKPRPWREATPLTRRPAPSKHQPIPSASHQLKNTARKPD